jgi:hypothetical protein
MEITIANKNGVKLNTKGKICKENISINIDPTNLEGKNILEGKDILGVQGTVGKYDGTYEGEYHKDSKPIEVHTVSELMDLCTGKNLGNVYKYTGATQSPYETNIHYQIIDDNGVFKAQQVNPINLAVELLTRYNTTGKYVYGLFERRDDLAKLLESIDELEVPRLFANVFKGCTISKLPKFKVKSIPWGVTDVGLWDAVPHINSICQGCTKLKRFDMDVTSLNSFHDGPNLDMSNAFYGCTEIEEININYANGTDLGVSSTSGTNTNVFYNCQKLKRVTGSRLALLCSNSLYNCMALEEIRVKYNYDNFQVGSGTTWGHMLSIDSLLSFCQACVASSTSHTLTVGSANITKLSDVYVKVTDPTETRQYPLERCDSTDEEAMTVSTYMSLKNWRLA